MKVEGAKFPLVLNDAEWVVLIKYVGDNLYNLGDIEFKQIDAVYYKLKEQYEKATGEKV